MTTCMQTVVQGIVTAYVQTIVQGTVTAYMYICLILQFKIQINTYVDLNLNCLFPQNLEDSIK